MSEDALPLAVAALVVDGDRYLVIRRAPGVPAPGYWTPLTGRVEPGESFADAVARECVEEVGLAVDVGPEVYRCTTADGRWMLVWHRATVAPAHPRDGATPVLSLREEEVGAAAWVTADEALTLSPMFPATRAFFERARGG